MNSAVLLLSYIRKNEGPWTKPCGNPQILFQAFEYLSMIITICFLQIKRDDNRLSKDPSIPNYSNS